MDEKVALVLELWLEGRRPRDLALLDHLCQKERTLEIWPLNQSGAYLLLVDVDEPGIVRQEQLSLLCKESLALVDDALHDDELIVQEERRPLGRLALNAKLLQTLGVGRRKRRDFLKGITMLHRRPRQRAPIDTNQRKNQTYFQSAYLTGALSSPRSSSCPGVGGR